MRALTGIPRVDGAVPLPPLIVEALRRDGIQPQAGDVLVLAHKLVSKGEGRVVPLAEVEPGPRARELAARTGKDPRLVELILQESVAIVRASPGLIIAEHRCGTISANAGIDLSNAGPGGQWAVLLPEDPDASAARLRAELARSFGADIAVIIADTQGRPFRLGAVGVAIGAAGIAPLRDWRGKRDLYGYVLRTSTEAIADELAAAATLLMGQSDEGTPAVWIRGLSLPHGEGGARSLRRPPALDLFR